MKETLRSEWVKCGKGCGGCPHGPYWYAYWRAEGKVHKRYVGKELPKTEEKTEEEKDTARPAPPHRFDAILSDRTASRSLAYEILGVPFGADLATCKKAYWRLAADNHPDKHPADKGWLFIRANCAWAYLRRVLS